MSWCWLDLIDEPPADATAQAAVFELDGQPAGWLAAWRRRALAEPPADAVTTLLSDASHF